MWARSKPYIGYTSTWNWLDYAALTVPVMRAENDSAISQQWLEHVPWNESDQINFEQCKHFPHLHSSKLWLTGRLDDFDLIRGMPVGVQIIGGRYGEEKCIAVAKVLKDVLLSPVV